MPKQARCCVGFCDNNKRFPNLLVVRSHVKELKFHRWPKDPNLAELWRKQVAKGRSDNFNPEPGLEGTFVKATFSTSHRQKNAKLVNV